MFILLFIMLLSYTELGNMIFCDHYFVQYGENQIHPVFLLHTAHKLSQILFLIFEHEVIYDGLR